MCDLGVEIQGSMLEGRVKKVVSELHERNIPFIPHFWLSDEWFCPDGIPGIAIPSIWRTHDSRNSSARSCSKLREETKPGV